MGFLSGLALVLLTLVGYSSGTVLAGKGKRVVPELLDLILVVVLWIAALVSRPALGRALAILIWLCAGLAVGAALTALRRRKFPDRKPTTPQKRYSLGRLRQWWQLWKAFAAEMGNFQGRTILAFFYFFMVTPFGIPVRLFGDPLRMSRASGNSFWLKQKPVSPTLEKAREQF